VGKAEEVPFSIAGVEEEMIVVEVFALLIIALVVVVVAVVAGGGDWDDNGGGWDDVEIVVIVDTFVDEGSERRVEVRLLAMPPVVFVAPELATSAPLLLLWPVDV